MIWYSQEPLNQDKWVVSMHPGPGYFLDIGASHDTKFSNTKALEERGWKGLAIDPFLHGDWSNRKCKRSKVAVSTQKGFSSFYNPGAMIGGIEKDHCGLHKDPNMKRVFVKTDTISNILRKNRVPNRIGYISLDIEGGELNVVKTFPFRDYKVDLWSIEHNEYCPERDDQTKCRANREEIKKILEANGFERVRNPFAPEYCCDDFYQNIN
jgi:hypothetical protein